MMGVNINDKKYPFTEWIRSGLKVIETRNTPSLNKYIGRRIGIVRTGKGKAQCVAYATISNVIIYTDEDTFYSDPRHMITPDMNDFRFKDGVKYGYVISDVEEITPFQVFSRGIVARKLA